MSGGRGGRFRRAVLIAAGVVVALVALLAFFGAGAQLTQSRRVSIVVRVPELPPMVASRIRVGDPIFTDVAGVMIGRVSKVAASLQPVATSDSNGVAHLGTDSTNEQVDVTVSGDGRVGGGLVILHSQAVLAGRPYILISNRYFLTGTVASVDVR